MRMNMRSNLVIFLSILAAIVLVILPLPSWVAWFRPHWLLLVVAYWALALEDKISVGIAWLLGILLDILQGTLFAEHALAMCCIIFIVIKLRRKLRLFPMWQQCLIMGILVLLYQSIILTIQMIIDQPINSVLYWMSVITSAIIWPWVFILLRDFRRRFKVT